MVDNQPRLLWISLAVIVSGASALTARVSAAPPDLATIQASLESLRQSAPVTRIKYRCRVRIVKGSMNEILDPPRPQGTAPDVPNKDIVIETAKELVCDFRQNRSWCKGSDWVVDLEKDPAGNDRAFGYLTYAEGANDGTQLTSLTPKERIDRRSLSAGIKVPVEFRNFTLTPDGPDPEKGHAVYPIYLSQGCLPAPDQAISAKRFLPPFDPAKWRIAGTTVVDSRELPVIISLPDASGGHYEYVLRPDLSYVPCRWTHYYRGDLWHVASMAYDADLARPCLRSWSFQEYGAPGVLSREETYAVDSNATVEAIDDSLFRVLPAEGMIALDLGKLDFRIVGHDSVGFRTNYEANDYLARRATVRIWINVLILCTLLATGLGVVLYWVRRRKQR